MSAQEQQEKVVSVFDEIIVTARNLFNKKYVSAANFIYQTPPNNNLLGAIYGEQRTVGITARISYQKVTLSVL